MEEPTRWTQESIPNFAVVGKINMGKSSVLATLLEIDDQRVIRISPTPGETTRCQILPLEINHQEQLRFIDTPGFSRPMEAMRAIQSLAGSHSPSLKHIRQFVQEARERKEFADECELLEPVLEGAGILYIIDPSKPLRDTFLAEMEILRWTGRQRLALLNGRADTAQRTEWKERLGSYFNLVRTFNAHHARFPERKALLQSLLQIDEAHRMHITQTIQDLDLEWNQRRESSAEAILKFLEQALTHRETVHVQEHDISLQHRRERIVKNLTAQYYQTISKMEVEAGHALLNIYRHQLISLEEDAQLLQGLDLAEEETWQKWGLSRSQLTLAGGAAGAAAGIAIDLGTGGLTHGVGTLLGACGGAAAAFFKGNELPDLVLDLQDGVTLAKGEGTAFRLGPPRNDNFPWILLDSLLGLYREVVTRTHARREDGKPIRPSQKPGLVKSIAHHERSHLAKWFASCQKGAPDRRREPAAFQAINQTLEHIEQMPGEGDPPHHPPS